MALRAARVSYSGKTWTLEPRKTHELDEPRAKRLIEQGVVAEEPQITIEELETKQELKVRGD
jgi:hypothetical protein